MQQKQLTLELDQLLLGKKYQRGGSIYPSTSELVSPFIDNLSKYTTDFKITVVEPNEGTATTEEDIDKTYTRVLIEGYMPNILQDNHRKTISMLYGLDVQTPVVKIYSGWENMACLNLSVFSPKNIAISRLSDTNFSSIYDHVSEYGDQIGEEQEQLQHAIEDLNAETYNTREQLNERIGRLAHSCLASQGLSSAYCNMVNFLNSPKEKNGVKNIYYKSTGDYTGWDLYQALTATPSNKSLDKANDVLKIWKLFSEN